jgi:hypothetical protein
MFKKSLVALSALVMSMGAFASTAASAMAASAPAVAASVASAAASDPGLLTAVFGFFGGLLLTWPALVALALLGVLFEANGARGWAVFAAIVTAAVSYFFFHVALATIGIGAVVYLVVGLLWSFYRYKRHASDIVEKFRNAAQRDRERALELLHPKEMLGTITAWIMIWPFSFIEHFVGDLITGIQTLVSKFFRGVYHRIYDSAVSQLTK